ncbi:MAG: glycosyltransferase family 9 protein [Planctomycetes bacterium]|nr:glycosyltransferase family 9 protein [Planctomycetota bacterium]
MQIVEAITDARVLDHSGRPAYELRTGERYVLYDDEAHHGMAGGALRAIGPLDSMLPHYRGRDVEEPRFVLPFIGRLGDALVAAACLAALRDRIPNCRIDVAVGRATRQLWEIIDLPITLQSHPLPADELGRYSHYLSLEGVESIPDGGARRLADVFSHCMHTPLPRRPAPLITPSFDVNAWLPSESNHPSVGIALGPAENPRTYPIELVLQLAQLLIRRGVLVVLLGQAEEVGGELPTDSPRMINLVGRTERVASLAGVVASLDMVVGPDSFLMHLAAAVNTPFLALFTSTNPVLAGDYSMVWAVSPSLECSPCGVATGACPLGHGHCVAPYHSDLRPTRLCRLILSRLRTTSRGFAFAPTTVSAD